MENQNEIKLVDYFNEHWYKIGESYIASVTTKLSIERKPNLDRWRGDVGNREADLRMHEAGDRGKRIHYAWWIYLMGGIVLYNPWEHPFYTPQQVEELKKENIWFMVLTSQDEMLQLWKLQRFFEIVNPIILDSEMKIYSLEKDIAGTLDNAFLIEKGTYDVNGSKKLIIPKTGIYIADLKTGKTVDDSVWNQLAPYTYCYEHMRETEVTGALILHTGSMVKLGIAGLSVPLRTREELEHDLEIYFKIADIWKERNPKAGPEVFSFPSLIKRKEK